MNEIREQIAVAEEVQPAPPTDEEVFSELAKLSSADYDRIRKAKADELDIRPGTLDREVEQRRPKAAGEEGGSAVLFKALETWPDPVDGASLLDEIAEIFSDYVVLPDHGAEALALWVMHTYAHDAAVISPILALESPEKRCGKSTCLNLLQSLVLKPLPASNITTAALFRSVEKWGPCLLIDEADTFLRDNEELRGVLNSGHNRFSASIIRVVGQDLEPRSFRTWAPKAIAKIGRLPDTLADRAVAVRLRRKRPDEQRATVRLDRLNHARIRRQAQRWAHDHDSDLRAIDPALPKGLHDRAADNWRCLLSIADTAGGPWLDRARKAAVALSAGVDNEDDSIVVMLLTDLRKLFDECGNQLETQTIVEALTEMEERPWPEFKAGKPITPRRIASLLKRHKIEPRRWRDLTRTCRGYFRSDFEDAFSRYLPPQSDTSDTTLKNKGNSHSQSDTNYGSVSDWNSEKPNDFNSVSDVSDWIPPAQEERGVSDESDTESEVQEILI